VVKTTCILSLNANDYVEVKYITPNNYTVNYWIGEKVNGIPGLISDLTSCMQLNVFQIAYNGPTGPQSTVTGPTGYTGVKGPTGPQSTVTGPTGPPATAPAYTTLTTATMSGTSLPLVIASNNIPTVIDIPNATVIYINNNTGNSKFITNMNGGVNGRMVIFTLLISLSNNGDVTFTQQFAKNGTGIYIGNLNSSVSLTYGKSICFVYMSDASLPNTQAFNFPGTGTGLWMFQY